MYDLTGLIGIKYNGNIYHYTKNLQGDIIGLLDANNEQVVSYEYDSWGSLISIKDQDGNVITDENNIGIINPFRYREYYYDSEIGMYYLNSRYYNPTWGRFINTDGIIGANQDILGYNLYAYVSNNPINSFDIDGQWKLPNWAKIVVGVAVLTVGVVATVASGGTLGAAIVGALKVTATTVAISVATKVVSNVVNTVASGGGIEEVKKEAFKDVDDAVADGIMAGGITSGLMMGTQTYLNTIADDGFSLFNGKVQGMYRTPKTPGGTFISIKPLNKFHLDLDILHGLHWHLGKGSAGKVHHVIIPWVFQKK